MSVPVVDPNDTLAVLIAAREWLRDPAHWCTGALRRDARGRDITDKSARVAKACGLGAMGLVSGRIYAPMWAGDALETALGDSPAHVNDGPDGYNRILAGYDKAIATEREKRGLTA